MERVKETVSVNIVIDSPDITTAVTSDYMSMVNFRNVYAAVKSGEVASTKTVTLSLLQATAADGTDSKALGTPVIVTAAEAQALEAEIEMLSNEFDTNGDFAFVAVKVESNNATDVTGAVAMVLGNKRDR